MRRAWGEKKKKSAWNYRSTGKLFRKIIHFHSSTDEQTTWKKRRKNTIPRTDKNTHSQKLLDRLSHEGSRPTLRMYQVCTLGSPPSLLAILKTPGRMIRLRALGQMNDTTACAREQSLPVTPSPTYICRATYPAHRHTHFILPAQNVPCSQAHPFHSSRPERTLPTGTPIQFFPPRTPPVHRHTHFIPSSRPEPLRSVAAAHSILTRAAPAGGKNYLALVSSIIAALLSLSLSPAPRLGDKIARNFCW